MKKINLAITGCLGRMGQNLIKSVKSNNNFNLVALTENRKINKKINGIKLNINSEQVFKKANLIIDFTVPKCTLQILRIASKLKKRVVIGTTGFNKKEELIIKNFSKKIPILKAGNMSLGINLLMFLTEITSGSLGKNFLSKNIFFLLSSSIFFSLRKEERSEKNAPCGNHRAPCQCRLLAAPGTPCRR